MEELPRTGLSRSDMLKRVAFFKDLKGSDGGLPDSKMTGCIRTLYNVIGFQPPKGEGGAVTSPVGDDASVKIGPPAGREADQHLDLLALIERRLRESRARGDRERQGRDAGQLPHLASLRSLRRMD